VSLQQFFDDARQPAAPDAASVRVFSFVARTPFLPEARAWNHPLGVLLITMCATTTLATIPGMLPALVVASLVLSLVLTVCGSLSYFMWARSRTRAVLEGAWVASQSGYRVNAHGQELRWIDWDGSVKDAVVVRGDQGWDLVLTGRVTSGNFSF
jgi:hypothetical protein